MSKSLDSQPAQGKGSARADAASLQGSRSFDTALPKQRLLAGQQRGSYEQAGLHRSSFPGSQRGMAAFGGMTPQMFYPSSMYYPAGAYAMPAGGPYMAALGQEQVLATLAMQVEYYFSVENLCKDIFLRSKMDEEGWIPVAVIAGFNRIRMLTPDVNIILAALANSRSVEVSPNGLKLRPIGNYQAWVLPKEQRDASAHAQAEAAAAAAMQTLGRGVNHLHPINPGGGWQSCTAVCHWVSGCKHASILEFRGQAYSHPHACFALFQAFTYVAHSSLWWHGTWS